MGGIAMTQEDKELLLKDLCARLPYGVKCENYNHIDGRNVFKVTDIRDNGYICGTVNNHYCYAIFDPLELKPYLFPLSSMTEEQEKEYNDLNCYELGCFPHTEDALDYLIKNHFDFRCLIPKGLAIDATGLNIY